jgi:RNA ligase (TIGR02306 family)
VESRIFGPESKVKLNNSRVRTIKLRGAISQGLVVTPDTFSDKLPGVKLKEGTDVTKILGVTKYEAPSNLSPRSGSAATSKKQTNPNFRKYTGIENAKNYPKVFEDGEEVIVTEKVHGTNFRAGYVPFHADTLWKRIKLALNIAPKYDFVYGSHNVQLQSKLLYKGFYETNVYAEAVVKYSLRDVLKPGEVVYGEIYGDGIQKGYIYGCKKGERKLVLFDVMKDGVYLDAIEGKKFIEARHLPYVPVLYTGPFDKEKIIKLRDGDSVMAPSQKVREGVIVKPLKEITCFIGRKMLKYISDAYLLKNQDNETEAH